MSESTLTGGPVISEVESSASDRSALQRIGALLSSRSMVPFWLMIILLIGAVLRFTGIDWDQGTHRHPDERHLTMVIERVGFPSSVSEYLDEANSPLNPRNNDFAWFYGDFAITIVKGTTKILSYFSEEGFRWDSYGEGYKVGRRISALFDLATLLLLFLLARRLYNDHRIGLLAAFLFSVTVLSIQHSHFWVVDNFVTFFVTLTLYWLVTIFQSEGSGHLSDYILAGLSFGAAMAIKVSVFTLALIFAVVGAYKLWVVWQEKPEIEHITTVAEQLISRLLVAALFSIIAFRLLHPYAFSGTFEIGERWWGHMQEVRGQVTGEADPPWGFQWANRTAIIFPLKNMVLWGMGLPLGLAAWAGWGVALWLMFRKGRQYWLHLIPVAWITVLFLHQGIQWVKSLRYFLPIYPMLIMLAAWLLVWLWDKGKASRRTNLLAWTAPKAALLATVVVGGTFLYALAFTNMYREPHTHLQAAQWIYDNIPSGSIVATEHYDEGIPLGSHLLTNTQGKSYPGLSTGQLSWYHEDNPQKLEEALNWLDEAEYIVPVSNRLYGSTARMPARFPMTVNYYQALFSGELGWERVADFTSGPQLFGIELDDQFSAEEAFSVYDHPRAQIFKKTDAYSREKAREILSEGVDWDNISRLTAKQWTDTGGEVVTIKFTDEERAIYEEGGTWSTIFNPNSLQNRIPLIVWALLVQVIGLLTLPYMRTIGRGLPDHGYTFAKALGLLLISWLVWMVASLKLLAFSPLSIALAILLVGLGGAALLWHESQQRAITLPSLLRRWWQEDKRLFLLTEVVFWGFFLLVLAIRWANPDIWHDPMGGEKPMDFAYLNAVIKSTYFPAMDPWFAGGYINYYYFGFVIVAVLIKFTGILPEIAYNLAVPTLFAMMAAGTWGAALALLVPLRKLSNKGSQADSASVPAALEGQDEQLEAVAATYEAPSDDLASALDGLDGQDGQVAPYGHDISTPTVLPQGKELLKLLLEDDEKKQAAALDEQVAPHEPLAPHEPVAPHEPLVTTEVVPHEPLAPQEPVVTTSVVPHEPLAAQEPVVTTSVVPHEPLAPQEPLATTPSDPEGPELLSSLLQADDPPAPKGHDITTPSDLEGPELLPSLLQADDPPAPTPIEDDEPVVVTTSVVPEGPELLPSLLQADDPPAPKGHDITTPIENNEPLAAAEVLSPQADDEEKGLMLLTDSIELAQQPAAKVVSSPIGTATYEPRPPLSPFALFFASLAALFVSVLGNLGELKVVTNGLSSLSQSNFRSGIPGLETLVRSLDGLVRGILINGQPLAGRAEWPYWNATRTIEGTINEFPWFTFLYADLHAHMMALPFALLAIGVALSFMRAPHKEGWLIEGLRLGFMALVLGALWPINTWDFPTYALIAFAGLGLREWRRDGSITAAGIWAVLWRWGLILLLSRLLFKPFHDNLASAYSSVELWEGSRTELSEFLIVHGFFLFSIFFALINDFAFGHGHNPIVRLLRFKLGYFGRGKRASHLYKRLVGAKALNPSALYGPFITLLGIFFLAALIGYAVPALTLCLLLFSLLLFFRSHPQTEWQMVLFFIMLGLGLTLSVEIVVLKGDIGRMNTVFKFYLQVWVLWGMAAALGAAQVVSQQKRWLPEWRFVWRTGMALLCGIALLYPIFATYAKINDRLDASVGPTLNGAAFLEKATLNEVDRNTQTPLPIPFKWDAAAIRWIRENIPGSPTIAEVNTAPEKLYGWGNRYAVWTGNPAIIGWDHHQRQQRAATRSIEVDQRVREVKENIFNTPDAQIAHETLLSYGADYIIIGPLERAYSRPEGIAKFEPNRGLYWDLIYDENPEVKIYKVLQ